MRHDERNWPRSEISLNDQGDDRVVTCTCCECVFEAFAPAQAEGCAADIVGPSIVGFQGSHVADMRRFLFVEGRQPEHLATGQICDECISQLLSEGAIVDSGELLHPFTSAPVRRPTYH